MNQWNIIILMFVMLMLIYTTRSLAEGLSAIFFGMGDPATGERERVPGTGLVEVGIVFRVALLSMGRNEVRAGLLRVLRMPFASMPFDVSVGIGTRSGG